MMTIDIVRNNVNIGVNATQRIIDSINTEWHRRYNLLMRGADTM